MKKMYLEKLPRWESGRFKGKINWTRCAELKCRVRFIYEDIEGYIEIIGYDSAKECLYIRYLNEETFKIKTVGFRSCQIGKVLRKITKEFKYNIGQIVKDDKRDLTIMDNEYREKIRTDGKKENEKWYKYKCNKCGWGEGWIKEGDIIRGNGCSCCRGITVVEGINDITTISPWMVKFFVNPDDAKLYTCGVDKKVKTKCPDCGRVKDSIIKDIYKCKSIGCICGDKFSYGHKYVHNLLTQLDINFKDNHTLEFCKFYNPYKKKEVSGEYDFVIEDMKLIIEVDGGFHRKDNNLSGQKKEESEFLDSEKDRLAKENGYKEVIRINYDDTRLQIKDNILISELVNIFDLSTIDWNQCEEFALSNRVKEACELKKRNPDMSTKDIGEVMKLSQSTIRSYLNKGNELGFCNYNINEEFKKEVEKLVRRLANQLKYSKMDFLLVYLKVLQN